MIVGVVCYYMDEFYQFREQNPDLECVPIGCNNRGPRAFEGINFNMFVRLRSADRVNRDILGTVNAIEQIRGLYGEKRKGSVVPTDDNDWKMKPTKDDFLRQILAQPPVHSNSRSFQSILKPNDDETP